MSRKFNSFVSIVESAASFHSTNDIFSEDNEHSINQICPDKYQYDWMCQPEITAKEHHSKLILDLYKQPKSGDVTIQIDDQQFKCQKLILQSYSHFFLERPRNETKTVLRSNDIQANVFCKIYEWMMSSDKTVERERLISLIIGAEYLQVDFLVQQCWNLIQNLDWFNEDQAYFLYREAHEWKHITIEVMMLKQIKKIFLTLVSSLDFLMMDVGQIISLLELDNIGLNSEIDAFYAAVRWLIYNWKEREKYLMDVMKCVRLGLVESWRLDILKWKWNSPAVNELVNENKELFKMIDDSLSYAIYRAEFEQKDFPRFFDFLIRFKFVLLFERDWMADSYWQKWYSKSKYLYKDFLNYLNVIKSNALMHWTQIYYQQNKK